MRSMQRNDRFNPVPPERKPSRNTNLQRRGFLLALGVGGAGAAAVAIRTLPGATADGASAREAGADGGGYQMTEHVKRYYRTAKL